MLAAYVSLVGSPRCNAPTTGFPCMELFTVSQPAAKKIAGVGHGALVSAGFFQLPLLLLFNWPSFKTYSTLGLLFPQRSLMITGISFSETRQQADSV